MRKLQTVLKDLYKIEMELCKYNDEDICKMIYYKDYPNDEDANGYVSPLLKMGIGQSVFLDQLLVNGGLCFERGDK